MDRIAVFVDAGYLYAQGSTALTGSKVPRDRLSLNDLAIVEKLTLLAQEKSDQLPLLRIYWYDGISVFRGPGAEQTRLAKLDNIKVRFGFINNAGQQKGVDSLIITDLIDLARNGAISDALLLSGDEDVRIGVQVAQSYGVRVHLVGIAPSRGSQSMQLIQEADTTTEWDRAVVESFLNVSEPTEVPRPEAVAAEANAEGDSTDTVIAIVDQVIAEMDETATTGAREFMQSTRGVPPDYDGRIIGRGRDALGRPLTEAERRLVRIKFREKIVPAR